MSKLRIIAKSGLLLKLIKLWDCESKYSGLIYSYMMYFVFDGNNLYKSIVKTKLTKTSNNYKIDLFAAEI